MAARHLQRWHGAVNVFVLGPRPDDDPKRDLALDAGATIIGANEDPVGALERALPTAFIVVDAVLGIGAARPLEGAIRDALTLVSAEQARRDSLQVLALDVPTGIDAESGEADPNTLSADATVTFGFPKHGHFRFPAAGHAGRLIVADIGVSGELAADIPDDVVTTAWARAALPRRPLDAHKGSFGRVLALAGSPSYVGAAHLACMGAARSGAGYVTLAVTPAVQALVVPKLTESTYLLLPDDGDGVADFEAAATLREAMAGCDALLVGCGLGQHDTTRLLLEHLLLSPAPLPLPAVIDADALNFLAGTSRWWERMQADAVLTPHPGEMARLLRCGIAEVEADRIGAARTGRRRLGRDRAAEGRVHGRCRAGRPRARAALRQPGPGNGGDRRRAGRVRGGAARAGAGAVRRRDAGGLLARRLRPACRRGDGRGGRRRERPAAAVAEGDPGAAGGVLRGRDPAHRVAQAGRR